MNSGETLKISLDKVLEDRFPGQMKRNGSLARYTSARLGGPADIVLEVRTTSDLIDAASILWDADAAFKIIGGGSNILISDDGYRGVMIINRVKKFSFEENLDIVKLYVESGASLGVISRLAAAYGYSGLEWAVGIPGTVGGAVVGNAGAHGSDISKNIFLVNILHRSKEQLNATPRREDWSMERCAFSYRSSYIKRHPGNFIVLEAVFHLLKDEVQNIQRTIQKFTDHRYDTQPPGASIGSMFKNPEGDYAGRLIEQAGLKGLKIGGAQISEKHANFFLNMGDASSSDVYSLIQQVRNQVLEQSGIMLETEIELIGKWKQ